MQRSFIGSLSAIAGLQEVYIIFIHLRNRSGVVQYHFFHFLFPTYRKVTCYISKNPGLLQRLQKG
jgi:hypothetical protein